MTDTELELWNALAEMREATCAAMRVIADLDAMKALGAEEDTREARFITECRIAGVKDGFGKRADDLLKRLRPEALA